MSKGKLTTLVSTNQHLPSLDEQRNFWNWHWQNVDSRKVLNEWTERRSQEMLAVIRSLGLPNPKILDFGCGQGWFTERLADIGSAYGIDLSPDGIAAAKARRPDIHYIAGNVYDADLPTAYFDVVVSSEVIAHVEDQPRYIDRAAQILKPGGYLLVTTGNKFVMDRLGEVGWTVQPPQHIARQFYRKELASLLASRGFVVCKSFTIIPHGQVGILRLVNSVRINSIIASVLGRERLIRLKETLGFGWQMIFLAQKRPRA